MIGVSIPLKEHDETRLGEMNIQTDYLCAGNIIGEMGMLTGSARNASVTCETTVQVCSGMVWCGVVWCGVVWCGVVWCGMVWYGMVWYGMVWYGMVWCGMVWCGVVWYGVVWCGMI